MTTEHPLATEEGSIKKAQEFMLRPVTHDLTSNIVVAEGYLNGSGRYQSELAEELNRLILRHNVPDGLIPSP